MDSGRRGDDWYRSWMTGPARLQVENRKREAAELYAALTPSSDISYDAQTLQDLIHILNHEFLCHKLHVVGESASEPSLFGADDFPIALPRAWATGLLSILSSCLVKSVSPTAYRERELQCRALLATIALLLAQKVEALQNDFHNGFHQSLSRRFEDLVWQPGPTGELTQQKFCKVQCSYLLAAAEEYSCRFRRAEPWALTVSRRIINLLSFGFSVSSPAFGGGGFNLQAALSQLSEGLREVAHKPDRQYEAMFNIQELAMLVNALQLYQATVIPVPDKADLAKAAASCASNLGLATLDSVMAIINENDAYETKVAPPPEFWQKYVLAPLHRGPPSFNTYYYLYGIVDCAAQIGKSLGKPVSATQLGTRLRKAVIEGGEATHRWKALEYLVSVESNQDSLARELQKRIAPDEKARLQHEHEYISTAVRGEVASYPMQVSGIELDAKKRHRTIISPTSCNEKTGPAFATPKVSSSCDPLSIRSPEFPTKHVLSAGLSPDCTAAFSQTVDKAVVVSLSNLGSRDNQPMLAKQQKADDELYEAVISNKYLATITVRELRVTAYRHTENTLGDHVGTEPLGKTSDDYSWVPYALAIHDARRRTWIAVAGETTAKGSTCGIVEIFEVFGDGTKGVLRRHNSAFTQATRETLAGSSIRSVNFSPNGGRLVCITNDNRILIWLLSNNLRPRNAPFMIRQKFAEGPGVAVGLTSATIFQGPSAKNYVLATTWPSLERHRNGGEWSFVSPIASSPADIPKRVFHRLKDVGDDAGPIIAGAASSIGEMIALWEDNGQIMILPLEGNNDGGFKCREVVELAQKKKSAFKQTSTSPSSMRFRHAQAGMELFVLSRTGTILHKRFEGFDNRASMQSPRPSIIAGVADDGDYLSVHSLRQTLSQESKSDEASVSNFERLRVDSQNSGDTNPDLERAFLNETIGKVPALSFTDELSVTSQLILTRTDCPKDSLWRRTLAQTQEDYGEQPIHDYFAAFKTYLQSSEAVDVAMAECTLCRDVIRRGAAGDALWTFRPPKTPSTDMHMHSAREIYAWLWYVQDIHARTMAGAQLLHDESLLEGFINLIVSRDPSTKIARLLPVSLELLDAITETILRSIDVLKPHLDDPREMGLMEIFDALSPFKRLLESVSGPFGLFEATPQSNDDDMDSELPTGTELERFRLLTEMILLAVMSYPGSHATDFPIRHLGANCEGFRMQTSECSVTLKRQHIACLRDFVQNPLWVFSFEDAIPANPERRGSVSTLQRNDLFLSTSIPDFADLWGRLSLIYPRKGEPEVSEIDWPGGTLRAAPHEAGGGKPLTVASEVLCHTQPWSDEAKADSKSTPFDSRKRIIIQ